MRFCAVIVSNVAGNVTSNNAILTVHLMLQSYLKQFSAHECKAPDYAGTEVKTRRLL